MASYHFSVKSKSKGYAVSHFFYIARLAHFQHIRESSQEVVEYIHYGACMPSWVSKPSEFWKAADTFERANAKAYMEYEFALPNELTAQQRISLVNAFLEKHMVQHQYPHSYAIHNVKSRLSGEDQPHCHLMFSLRADDGISRSPEQYFKRYNAKSPEKGGVRKKQLQEGFEGYSEFLLFIRKEWEHFLNDALAQYAPYQQFNVGDQVVMMPNRVSADSYEQYNADHGTFYLSEPKLGVGKKNESVAFLEEIKTIREHNLRERELELQREAYPQLWYGLDGEPYSPVEVNYLAEQFRDQHYGISLDLQIQQGSILNGRYESTQEETPKHGFNFSI